MILRRKINISDIFEIGRLLGLTVVIVSYHHYYLYHFSKRFEFDRDKVRKYRRGSEA